MTEQKKSKVWHISLWIVQGILAAGFGMGGFMKMTKPISELAETGMTFVTTFESGTVRFIGTAEVLGAIGLILPAALRILPILTPLAASGLSVVMILAIRYHVTHDEPFTPSAVLLLLSAIVAWGRFIKAPIQPKA